MSEESTVIYIYDEELHQISLDGLEQLTIQTELLQEQQKELSEVRQSNIVLLAVLGACLGALIFRHLRK